MTYFSSRSRRFVLACAVLIRGVSAMTTVAAYPTTQANTTLGAEWSCWRMIWLTSCTRVRATESPRVTEPSIRADMSFEGYGPDLA